MYTHICVVTCIYIGVHLSFLISVLCSLTIYPAVKLLDRVVVLFLVFEEPPYYSSQRLCQFTFPPTVYKGSLFSVSLLMLCRVFDDSHSDMWVC